MTLPPRASLDGVIKKLVLADAVFTVFVVVLLRAVSKQGIVNDLFCDKFASTLAGALRDLFAACHDSRSAGGDGKFIKALNNPNGEMANCEMTSQVHGRNCVRRLDACEVLLKDSDVMLNPATP